MSTSASAFAMLSEHCTIFGERMSTGEERGKLRGVRRNSKSRDAVALGFEPRKPFVGGQKMRLGFVQQIEIDAASSEAP